MSTVVSLKTPFVFSENRCAEWQMHPFSDMHFPVSLKDPTVLMAITITINLDV